MPSFFSRKKGKDGPKVKKGAQQAPVAEPSKPRWEDAWMRKEVEAEEVQELLHGCTVELKSRGMKDDHLHHPAIRYAAFHCDIFSRYTG